MALKNKHFLVLEFFAILFVVVGHCGGINITFDWFPIYSFHMPLWFFISGYFYVNKDEKVTTFLKYKIKKLVIPFFIINTIFIVIVQIFKAQGIITYGGDFNLDTIFINPWISNSRSGFFLAGWYVLTLFSVQLMYFIFRKVLHNFKFSDVIITLSVIFLCFLGIYSTMKGMNSKNYFNLIFNRAFLSLFFYHLGYLYKNYFEKKVQEMSFLFYILLFIIQLMIMCLVNGNLNIYFWNMDLSNYTGHSLLLLVEPILGILIWLKISEMVSKVIPDNSVILKIGSNTWSIMAHHQFIIFLINLCFYFICNYTSFISTFNIEAFKTNQWYTWQFLGIRNFNIIYLLCGMGIPIMIKLFLTKSKNKVLNKIGNYY